MADLRVVEWTAGQAAGPLAGADQHYSRRKRRTPRAGEAPQALTTFQLLAQVQLGAARCRCLCTVGVLRQQCPQCSVIMPAGPADEASQDPGTGTSDGTTFSGPWPVSNGKGTACRDSPPAASRPKLGRPIAYNGDPTYDARLTEEEKRLIIRRCAHTHEH